MLGYLNSFLLSVALVTGLCAAAQQAGAAATTEQIEEMIEHGRLNEALSLTDAALNADKENVNYLFLKGLILTRQNKLDSAKDLFIRLTREHPELPEPFNNLAVIYAEQGDYNSAREALQDAINTHPSYATAQENLGDIYAKMASKAYNQALELDQDNTTAREKLLLVSDLFSTRPAGQTKSGITASETDGNAAAEVSRLEQQLQDTRLQTEQELERASQVKQEIDNLRSEREQTIETFQAQRKQAEQSAREAAALSETAMQELAKLREQISRVKEQSSKEQQAAATQRDQLRQEIANLSSELQKLKESRDSLVDQLAVERKEAELQTRMARDAAQKAGSELTDLERRARDMRSSIDRQAAAAEELLNQSKIKLQQNQAEITRLERQRAALAQNTGSARPGAVSVLPAADTADTGGGNEQEVIAAVRQWAELWSKQDVDGYLSTYAGDFRPSDGIARTTWAAQRRDRISNPRYIRVDLGNIRVTFVGEQHARVTFRQSYKSDAFQDNVEKTLVLQFRDGRWLIVQETSG
jgi:hypothetical protein